MASRASTRLKKLTVSALLVALGVLFLYLGSLLDVLDLSTAALASLLVAYSVLELSGPYPYFLWLGTSLLGLLLLPQKSPALFYALFAGYYPIVKAIFEKKLPGWLAWILKILVFHVSLAAFAGVLKLFFPGELSTYFEKPWLPLALYGLSLVCFVLFDLLLSRLIPLYYNRLQKYLRIK
ncbi:MAG: hypothetical protein IJR88_06005 [Clostridia bacterium]|nr:hypothetical protein [Clostridia bacterium]